MKRRNAIRSRSRLAKKPKDDQKRRHNTQQLTRLQFVSTTNRLLSDRNVCLCILKFAMIDPKAYYRISVVCKKWNSWTMKNNELWWPIFRRLWTNVQRDWLIAASPRHDESSLLFTRLIMSKCDKNPKLLAPKGVKGGAWHEQYQAVLNHHFSPRLVFVDCQDGRAFIPSAGWYSLFENSGVRVPDYWKIGTVRDKVWISQLVNEIRHLPFIDDNEGNDSGYDSGDEYRTNATQRQQRIVTEHIEWVSRLRKYHSFCIHWTYLTDKECFQEKKQLSDILTEDSCCRQKNQLLPSHSAHDASSGWMCDTRCAAFVAFPVQHSWDDHAHLEYQLLTSNTCRWETTMIMKHYASNIFAWAFEFEKRLRLRAGYRHYEPYLNVHDYGDDSCTNVSDRSLRGAGGSVEHDKFHYQVYWTGLCGYGRERARRELCRRFKFKQCPYTCHDIKLDVFWNGEKTSPKGCGALLGPGVRRYFPTHAECEHTIGECCDTEYCFACFKNNQRQYKSKCVTCDGYKKLTIRLID